MELGFYNTNLGVLYFDGESFLTPCENSFWEPVNHDELELITKICEPRSIVKCSWTRLREGDIQLRANLWWVGYVSKSSKFKNLYYWKCNLSGNSLFGYCESEDLAIKAVENICLNDKNYNYQIKNINHE